MTPIGATLSVAGICSNFPITAAASDTEYVRTTPEGQVNDGDLTFGANLASGPARLHYTTAAQWRALALAATRIADWMEA